MYKKNIKKKELRISIEPFEIKFNMNKINKKNIGSKNSIYYSPRPKIVNLNINTPNYK